MLSFVLKTSFQRCSKQDSTNNERFALQAMVFISHQSLMLFQVSGCMFQVTHSGFYLKRAVFAVRFVLAIHSLFMDTTYSHNPIPGFQATKPPPPGAPAPIFARPSVTSD